MTEQENDFASQHHSTQHHFLEHTASLLRFYSFDLFGSTIVGLLEGWCDRYPPEWIRLAAIEALYQGRYKAISVEQILAIWQRRGQPLHHFNYEFERLVCHNLPRDLVNLPPQAIAASAESTSDDRSTSAIVPSRLSPELLRAIAALPETPTTELSKALPTRSPRPAFHFSPALKRELRALYQSTWLTRSPQDTADEQGTDTSKDVPTLTTIAAEPLLY